MVGSFFDRADFKDKAKRDADYAVVAANTVQELAPAPDPLPSPDDYSPRARAAERLVYGWLQATSGGANTSESLAGISAGFAGLKAIQDIVRGQMGPYYAGGGSAGGDANTASVGPAPW